MASLAATCTAPATRRIAALSCAPTRALQPQPHPPAPQAPWRPRQASHPTRPKVACKAERRPVPSFDSSGDDLDSHHFNSLAKIVGGRLAQELGDKGEALGKLASWLQEVAASEEGAKKEAEKQEGAEKEGTLHKAGRVAAEVLGVKPRGGGKDASPADLAARYLGVDSFAITVDAVRSWLTSPDRKDDVKLVGALVYKMLKYFEKQTGEKFEGGEKQYSWLAALGRELLGSSMSKSLLKSLVKAYLRVPGG